MKERLTGSNGLTIIELLVVIVVIGVLVTIVVPNVMRSVERGRVAQTRLNLHDVLDAVHIYSSEHHGDYPPTEPELESAVHASMKNPYNRSDVVADIILWKTSPTVLAPGRIGYFFWGDSTEPDSVRLEGSTRDAIYVLEVK